jgi:hypothetical protein
MRLSVVLSLVVLMLLTALGGVMAQSEATPTPQLDSFMTTPVAPFASWSGSFQVRPGVPFVWLRQDPMSTGAVRETLPGSAIVQAIRENGGISFDGTQWWGFVNGRRGQGWVELNSLQPATVSTPMPTPNSTRPANWARNNVVQVKASVPFVWIRADMSAEPVTILGTYFPGTRLVIVAGPNLGPNQLYWQVRDPNSNTVGFVEQDSLEFVRSRPNFTVSPLPPSAWRAGFSVVVKSSVPFVWIRSEPNSNAGIVRTVNRGDALVLGEEVRNDGVQNWRRVSIAQSPVTGWVEENALQFDRIWTRF